MEILPKLKRLFSPELLEKFKEFFMGKWYPVWIAASVIFGRFTGLEIYFAMLDFVIVSVALLLCDSIRPVLPNLISFLYRISLEHGPGVPNYSTYYTGVRLVLFAAFATVFIVALVYFFVKNNPFAGFNIKSTPMLLPLLALSISFLMGGAFSDGWSVKDLLFAFSEVLVFSVVFLLIYFGLRKERAEEICNYFVYICAVTAVILIVQVLGALFTVDGIFVDGSIYKGGMFFGWGISNTCGGALTALIPICFLGAMKSRKYSFVYFVIATLTLAATVITLSRNAILIGGIFYTASVIALCFFGEFKKRYRIITAVLFAICLSSLLVFSEELSLVFADLLNKGFNDNGRYYLWNIAWDNFKSAPIFGIGFFSFEANTYVASGFTPRLAHNTPLQLMSSMGLFGLLSYSVYRVYSFIPFIRKPRKEKTLLLMSVGVLLCESLLDNFIFWFAPTFVYNISIVIALMYLEEDMERDALQIQQN